MDRNNAAPIGKGDREAIKEHLRAISAILEDADNFEPKYTTRLIFEFLKREKQNKFYGNEIEEQLRKVKPNVGHKSVIDALSHMINNKNYPIVRRYDDNGIAYYQYSGD